jgi:alkylation response protein AidB-like acyl-CoA dehydrogenase
VYGIMPRIIDAKRLTQGSTVEAETRYVPSTEQLALAGTIEDSLADLLPLSRLHTAHTEDAKTWAGLADIGIFGISRSEAQGGSGLGATEESLIAIGLGRRLAAPAVFATIAASHAPPEAAARVREAARVAAAYCNADRCILIEEQSPDFILVRVADAAALHEVPGGARQSLEKYLWLAELSAVSKLGAPLARYDTAQLLRLRLIDAAALAGMADGALEMAVGYAKIREQFGRPIGSFQAVKHHCANMVMAARSARDQVLYAAVAVDEDRADAQLQVECALYAAGTAALENAGKNIQIHGGIGFSDEADPHLFLKRAQLQLALAGGLDAANSRIAEIKVG